MIYRLLLVLLAVAMTVAYALAPPAETFPVSPETAKIMFFHVPAAMLCTLFFLWGAVMAVRYLLTRNLAFDRRSLAAIEIGTLLCLLATLTGAVFARMQWGAFWSWDPRQSSILTQLLIYAAYFGLRAAFPSRERAAANAGAYAIFAFLTVPFLVYVYPRVVAFTQHGGANQVVVRDQMDSTYRAVFYASAVALLLICAHLYRMRSRQAELSDRLEELDGLESGGGDSTGAGVVRPVRLRDVDAP